jgi:hypothetical protein
MDATKVMQWKAFMTRGRLAPPELTLAEVVEQVAAFLGPPLDAARRGTALAVAWSPTRATWDER